MNLYKIRNWKDRFEVAQAKAVKTWNWVAIPNKHDGLSYRRIMALPDGMAVYAAWCLIVQVASKCPVRGVLAGEDGPLDATDLALKTGGQKETFERALSVLSDKRIGWILIERYEHADSSPLLHNITEQDITEQNKTKPEPTRTEPKVAGKPREPSKVVSVESLSIPESLNTPEAISAIDSWLTYKRQRGQAYKEPDHVNRKLLEFARAGPDALIAAVNASIGNNYVGLFPGERNANQRTIGPGQKHRDESPVREGFL